MSQNPVTVSFDGGVAVITVNNPPVNTINAAVRAGLQRGARRDRGARRRRAPCC